MGGLIGTTVKNTGLSECLWVKQNIPEVLSKVVVVAQYAVEGGKGIVLRFP